MMRLHPILSYVAQGLSDEAARPAGQGEIAPRIAAKEDFEFTQMNAGRCAVGVIHHLRWHLSIQTKLIRGHRFGRQDPEVLISSNGRDNRVGGSPCGAKNRMGVGGIVESSRNAANFPVAHKPSERHPDRARVAEICEIVRRERPPAALSGDAPKDLPRVGSRSSGWFHVENNALFFQQIKDA